MTANKARFCFFSFLILLTGALSFVLGNNGDLPFYIAAALSSGPKTDADVLTETKAVILREQRGPKAAAHIQRIDKSQTNILDYYRTKPLYIWTIRALHRAGFNYFQATLIPSLISFFLIGVIVFSWSMRMVKPLPAMIFSLLLMLLNPSLILARLSTPDAISNMVLIIFYVPHFF